MRKSNKRQNFLEMVPIKNDKIKWFQLDSGCVQLQIHRDRCLERAVRLLFKTPTTMKIDLDEYGSFIWRAIDGQRNMASIASDFKSAFGEGVEPLYERLGTYMAILRNNQLIRVV